MVAGVMTAWRSTPAPPNVPVSTGLLGSSVSIENVAGGAAPTSAGWNRTSSGYTVGELGDPPGTSTGPSLTNDHTGAPVSVRLLSSSTAPPVLPMTIGSTVAA